jgi:hypothetical protein
MNITTTLDKPVDPDDLKNKVEFALEWAQKREFETSMEELDPRGFSFNET